MHESMNPTSFPLHSQKRGDDIKFFKIDLSDAFVGAKKLCANAHRRMSILQNLTTKFWMQMKVLRNFLPNV